MTIRFRCPRRDCQSERCPANQVFSCLTPQQDETLGRERLARRYDAGQVVIHCDTPALAVLSVHSGRVRLTRCAVDGRRSVVATRGPGDLLGVREVLSGMPYQVTAETLESSILCALPREAFLQVVRDCPELAMRLLGRLAREFLLTEEQLVARNHASVTARTASLLAAMTMGDAAPPTGHPADVVCMSREEMALLVGTARETLSRVLSQLAKLGALESSNGAIRILDRTVLERISGR